MNPKLALLRDLLLDGKVLRPAVYAFTDREKVLHAREAGEFDRQWTRVFKEQTARKAKRPLSMKCTRAVDAIRKAAYLSVFRLNEDPDFAAFTSDDFDLIATGLALDLQDPWLNGLWMSYRSGIFPRGKTKKIEGSLGDLI